MAGPRFCNLSPMPTTSWSSGTTGDRWKRSDSVWSNFNPMKLSEARAPQAASRNAAMYPEIVRLATVLSDSAWRRRLLAKDRARRGKAMLDLFELVLDGDAPYRAADPIYEWRLRQLAAADLNFVEIYLDITGNGPLSAEQTRALARILLDAASRAEHWEVLQAR